MSSVRSHSMALAALALFALPVPAQGPDEELRVGSQVPALACKSVGGESLAWSRWDGRAVVLFFYSSGKAYSKRGLDDVLAALAVQTELAERAAILVVANGDGDSVAIGKALAGQPFPGALVVDADRAAFRPYSVVAFPTVFCIDRERRIAEVAKGFGPLLPVRVTAGTRLAAGLIDRAEFEQILAGSTGDASGDESARTHRRVRMAARLFADGSYDQAREVLETLLRDEPNDPEAIGLLAETLLAVGRVADAEPLVQKLAGIDPELREVRLLRAEIALQRGEAEQALKHLEGMFDRDPRVALLEGRALEVAGRFEKAAVVYRRALEDCIAKLRAR